MRNRQRLFHFNEFTVLEVFLVVTLFGLVAGATYIALFPELNQPAESPVIRLAPTAEEYRTQAAAVLGPFLTQASALSGAELSRETTGKAMADFAGKTKTALLTLRLPSEMRETHLAFTLMLDRWTRYPWPNDADRDDLVAKTKDLATTYPWAIAVSN